MVVVLFVNFSVEMGVLLNGVEVLKRFVMFKFLFEFAQGH